MDAEQIRALLPRLRNYLTRFKKCFATRNTRRHLTTYVRGQLSDLPRKSVEPIALAADVAPRTLQQFLNSLTWDQEQLIATLQRIVAREHASPHAIGLIDETACAKKGDCTPGVQRQWCGATGKIDNCVVTVHLGYAADKFHTLLDSELFLPESWSQDRARCQQAGIPDALEYRPKWQIALELYDRARSHGVVFRYLTFDEGYGSKPEFLRELQTRQQAYVAEVPRSVHGWLTPPRVTERPYHADGHGRGRATPRIVAGAAPTHSIEYHLDWTPELKDQAWQAYRLKDTTRGPLVWEVKHVRFTPKDEQDLPGESLHLLVARNVLDRQERKFFLSNAPAETPVEELLLVAFSRWHVERCFEDQKTELGLDHFEGRSYLGMRRHQAVTAVTHLFLSRVCAELGEKMSRVDGLSGATGGRRGGAIASVRRACHAFDDRSSGTEDQALSATQRGGPPQSHQKDNPSSPRQRHLAQRLTAMPMGAILAL